MTPRCPRCDAAVLLAGVVLLEAQPHRLGVLGPDGNPLTRREVLAGLRGGVPVGRRRHTCGPPEQGALFAIPAGTDKPRSGRR